MRSPDYCRFHSLTDPRQHCSNYECNVNVICQDCRIGTSAEVFSRSHDAVIRVYNAGNVIATHEHAGGLMQRNSYRVKP
jgi:hypothetical protein